jgi:putative tricarboxylic transport membrane protein
MRSERALRVGGYVMAIGTLAVGGLTLYLTTRLRVPPIYASAGPQLFPTLIGIGTVAVGLLALLDALRGRLAPPGALEISPGAVVFMAGGLIVQIVTLPWLGWVPASTLLFMAGARAFGRRNIVLDFLIGLALSALTLLLFDWGLGLRLPVGSLFGR